MVGRRRSRVRLRGVLTSCKVACRKCFSTEHFLRLIPDHLGPAPPHPAAATATADGDGKQRDDMTDPRELNPGQTDRHLASGCSAGHKVTQLHIGMCVMQQLDKSGRIRSES